jgi:hypothetical protein
LRQAAYYFTVPQLLTTLSSASSTKISDVVNPQIQGRIKVGVTGGWSPQGFRKTEIEPTDYIEKLASLKSKKTGLYFSYNKK